jgi:hypothetical protein
MLYSLRITDKTSNFKVKPATCCQDNYISNKYKYSKQEKSYEGKRKHKYLATIVSNKRLFYNSVPSYVTCYFQIFDRYYFET